MGPRTPYHAISIFSGLEQQHPSSPLITKIALPLLMMARDGDHGKRPWSEGPAIVVDNRHLVR
jgi:hypothetical protein